jgi:hypothetical protein
VEEERIIGGERRRASCRCGALTADCEGEPVRVSVCHCLACQKRSGSAFAAQVRFPRDRVRVEGESRSWSRIADSGNETIYHFCPACGSTLHYGGGNFPDWVAIPLGAFDDPYFVRPHHSVWEERRHDWVEILGEHVEHSS